jgi:WD40 repeat protein
MIWEAIERLSEIEAPSNPFPGLRPFEFHENHLFFGRDGQSERLIEKLSQTRFLAVVGTSGSGKSSLIRAGLLPSLLGGMMGSAGANWRVALMRPGNDPIGHLALALHSRDAFGPEDEENRSLQVAITEATLRRGNLGLVEAVREMQIPTGENLLVLADQFEEIFRVDQGDDLRALENDKAAFVKLLLEAVRQHESAIYVVLTMRSDYLGDCAQFQDLPEAINEGQYLIPRLTREQRREAITGPIAVGGAFVTPRLINLLLNDVGDNPDQLPILQHALMRTWEEWKVRRSDHAAKHVGEKLDLCCYEVTGGMSAALSVHADEAYQDISREMGERGERLTEAMFKALTEKGADNREIRRPLTLAEICAITEANEDEVRDVIEKFRAPGRSFLMPPADVPLSLGSLIDISHESLIRNWKRLSVWVEEESESARIYLRLAETAELYRDGKAGLWSDPDLQIALDWREQRRPNPAWARRHFRPFELAMSFLEKSRDAREAGIHRAAAERLEKESRRRNELRRTRLFAVILAAAFLLSVVAAVFAWRQQRAASSESKKNRHLYYATSMNVAANEFARKNLQHGYEILESFLDAGNSDDVRSFYWYYLWHAYLKGSEAFNERSQLATSIEFSRDGRLLASGGDDGSVNLWDVVSWKQLASMKVHEGTVYSISLSPDGRTLASGGNDGQVKLFDVTNRREIAAFKGKHGPIYSVCLSPDGQLLASGTDDGVIQLWDIASRQEIAALKGHGGPVYSVALSPFGQTLASGSDDRTIRLWDLKSRREIVTLKGHENDVNSVEFNQGGLLLASASDDKTIKLWNVLDRKETATLRGHESEVDTVHFSPVGRVLISVSRDGTIKLWDIDRYLEILTLEKGLFNSKSGGFNSIALSPDGRLLASGSDDKTIKIWNLASQPDFANVGEQGASVMSVAVSSDGRLIASGSVDQTIKLWDVVNRKEIATLRGHNGPVSCVGLSDDGRVLVSGSDDQTVKLWDVASQKESATLKGHRGPVNSLALSSDGRSLASASDDGTIKIWDPASHQELATLDGQSGPVYSVVISRDRRFLASGSRNGVIKLWDMARRVEIASFQAHRDTIYSIALSADGLLLASGSHDGTVKLWDIDGRKEIGTLKGHSGPVNSVAFSPDGRVLCSASDDGSVKIWDVASRQELGTLKPQGIGVSHENAVAFSANGRLLVSGNSDGVLRHYLAATPDEVERQRKK